MISMRKKVNAYNLLDFVVSKEKRVYDCLLEIAIERRNASLALMQWIQVDSNSSIKNAISSLDEIHRMWLDVQIEFANEIIDSQSIKKMDESTEIYLNRLEEDIIEAKSVLKSKKYKAEVQKNTVLRNSLLFLMNSHLKLARKSESIFLTAIDIIEKISDFPCESKDLENIFESQQTGLCTNTEQIKDQADEINVVLQNQKHNLKQMFVHHATEDFPLCFVPNQTKKSDSTLPKSLPRNESDGYIIANKPRSISAPEFKTFASTIGNDNVGEEIREELSKYFQSSDYYIPVYDNDNENRSNNYSCCESINSNSYDSSNYELESKNVTVLSKTCSIEKSKNLIRVIFPFDKEFSLKPTPKLSPNLSPKLSPNLSPKLSPNPSPKLSPNSSPKLSPNLSPKLSPNLSPKLSPNSSPKHSPNSSPKHSPNSSPKLSPNPSPKLLRKTSPSISLNFTPDVSPKHP
ncbi:uncharacterized protein LOC101234344 isoform X2 [Hydra vulgaris]|uniref:uncharacterized protein LOC101234344 isoform X2 n=1 Tax=Hydra vulgaris TaxID=6087 RepID=UPI001F5E44C2|nr:uncharacterized protein LOC101234344 isoform X2 [Hydra vulgaris]